MTCSSFKHHSDSAYLSEKTTTAIGVFLIASSIDSQHSSPVRIHLRSRYGCNPWFLRPSYKNPQTLSSCLDLYGSKKHRIFQIYLHMNKVIGSYKSPQCRTFQTIIFVIKTSIYTRDEPICYTTLFLNKSKCLGSNWILLSHVASIMIGKWWEKLASLAIAP